MTRNTVRAFLLIAGIITSGCTHIADRYPISADNVVAIRALGNQKINVGAFSTSPGVAGTEIQCAGVAIAPPDGNSFAAYIRTALIADLKLAAAYSSVAPVTLIGNIDALEVDASALSLTGQWLIVLTVHRNGKSLTVSERYSFGSQTLNLTSCEGASRRLGAAVQNLVNKLVTAPEFGAIIKITP